MADIDRLFAAALDKFGHLDIVVANAGVELVNRSVLEFTEEDFDRLFRINTKGAFFTLQKAAKHVADKRPHYLHWFEQLSNQSFIILEASPEHFLILIR